MLLSILLYQAFLAVTIFAPTGGGLWGKFATDFRVWCFGYDSTTGNMRWTAAWILLSEPILLQGLIVLIWRNSLMDMIRFRPRDILPQFSAAVLTVGLIAGGLLKMAATDAAAADQIPPFPAQRIRTSLQPPSIELFNQHNDPVALEEYAGRVVLLTAIYSTCGTSCPMIMFQAKEVIAELSPEQREQVTVMAISLDPEKDNLESMARTAAAYGMDAPEFQFLNGDPTTVNAILDGLSIARIHNESTGQIDHANMYFLIDRQGTIAYRFNLSERHQIWLSEALRILIAETPPEETALTRLADKPKVLRRIP